MFLTRTQGRGWEPDAVLNWLALAGWGTHTKPSDQSDQPTRTVKAPDSTTVMSLSEIINNVCLAFIILRLREPQAEEAGSSSWMRSRIAVRRWIPLSWLISTNITWRARALQSLAYTP
jgi:hypothetical protein